MQASFLIRNGGDRLSSQAQQTQPTSFQGELPLESAEHTRDITSTFGTPNMTNVARTPNDVVRRALASVDVLAEHVAHRALIEHRIAAAGSPDRASAFKTLEQWVCRVVSVSADERTFCAVGQSLDPAKTEELGDFTFAEVSDDDRSLIAEGAVFYWSIGYRVEQWGQRSTESAIRFRRLPVWTERELQSARRRAMEQVNWFLNDGGAREHNSKATGS